MGISTVGYRSAKYNPSEWHESNYAKYYQAFVDRDNAERIRHESIRTEKGKFIRSHEILFWILSCPKVEWIDIEIDKI